MCYVFAVFQYLGKTHNVWHRSTLVLEQMVVDNGVTSQFIKAKPTVSEYEFEPSSSSPTQETHDALCDLYSLLKEEDMLVGLWQKRAKFSETNVALAYEQHGFFEQAQQSYEGAMAKARQDHNAGPASSSVLPEYRLWEDHWIRCVLVALLGLKS